MATTMLTNASFFLHYTEELHKKTIYDHSKRCVWNQTFLLEFFLNGTGIQ